MNMLSSRVARFIACYSHLETVNASGKNMDDIRNVGTFSWGGAFATTYWADPKENIVAVLMTQQLGAGPEWGELQNKFNVAIYQALK